MNDISIFIWTIIISVFDFFLVCIGLGYSDSLFRKFYERVRKRIYIFLINLIVFLLLLVERFCTQNISGNLELPKKVVCGNLLTLRFLGCRL